MSGTLRPTDGGTPAQEAELRLRQARGRGTLSLSLLAFQPILFVLFVWYAAETIPMGGNAGDPSAMRSSLVVAAVACLVALGGLAAGIWSIRTGANARGWAGTVLNGLVALTSGVMAASPLMS